MRRKNPKGEKRKNNSSFIIINKNQSAERKPGPVRSGPVRSVPPFRSQEQNRAAQIYEKIADASNNLIKRSRIVRRNTSAVSVAAKCRYMPIVICWNHWSGLLYHKFLAFAIIRKLNKIMKQDSRQGKTFWVAPGKLKSSSFIRLYSCCYSSYINSRPVSGFCNWISTVFVFWKKQKLKLFCSARGSERGG